jgi:hypothetical protein
MSSRVPTAYEMMLIERRIMEAEYLLDSTTAHVRKKGCQDMSPETLKRMYRALNAIRGARDRVRSAGGIKTWTLFAGAGGPDSRVKKQKPWKHAVSHGWGRDCLRYPKWLQTTGQGRRLTPEERARRDRRRELRDLTALGAVSPRTLEVPNL